MRQDTNMDIPESLAPTWDAAVKLALARKWITETVAEEIEATKHRLNLEGIKLTSKEILIRKSYLSPEQIIELKRETRAARIAVSIPGYELKTRLGKGGMGVVLKAIHIATGNTVAIKILMGDLAKKPKYIKRFHKEARAAALVSDSHIIKGIEVGEANGLHYFVMEYVEGTTLRQIVEQRQRLPEKEVVRVGLQISAALIATEKAGLVHRDIKPENIIITTNGSAKLCDLGLARIVEDDDALTKTGVAIGTPHYMSPEQIRGERKIDIRSDIYSLGATLYHLLTGRRLFSSTSSINIMNAQLSKHAPDPRSIAPEISASLVKVLQKSLSKEKENRYPNATALKSDLEDIKNGLSPKFASYFKSESSIKVQAEVPMAEAVPETPSKSKRHFPPSYILAVAGIMIGLLGAAISYWWFNPALNTQPDTSEKADQLTRERKNENQKDATVQVKQQEPKHLQEHKQAPLDNTPITTSEGDDIQMEIIEDLDAPKKKTSLPPLAPSMPSFETHPTHPPKSLNHSVRRISETREPLTALNNTRTQPALRPRNDIPAKPKRFNETEQRHLFEERFMELLREFRLPEAVRLLEDQKTISTSPTWQRMLTIHAQAIAWQKDLLKAEQNGLSNLHAITQFDLKFKSGGGFSVGVANSSKISNIETDHFSVSSNRGSMKISLANLATPTRLALVRLGIRALPNYSVLNKFLKALHGSHFSWFSGKQKLDNATLEYLTYVTQLRHPKTGKQTPTNSLGTATKKRSVKTKKKLLTLPGLQTFYFDKTNKKIVEQWDSRLNIRFHKRTNRYPSATNVTFKGLLKIPGPNARILQATSNGLYQLKVNGKIALQNLQTAPNGFKRDRPLLKLHPGLYTIEMRVSGLPATANITLNWNDPDRKLYAAIPSTQFSHHATRMVPDVAPQLLAKNTSDHHKEIEGKIISNVTSDLMKAHPDKIWEQAGAAIDFKKMADPTYFSNESLGKDYYQFYRIRNTGPKKVTWVGDTTKLTSWIFHWDGIRFTPIPCRLSGRLYRRIYFPLQSPSSESFIYILVHGTEHEVTTESISVNSMFE